MAIPNCDVSLIFFPIVTSAPTLSEGSGAVVDFWGVVRALEGGRTILGIDYEAHETMARHQLEKSAAKAVSDFELTQVILTHRIGFVPVGEASLFLRTMSGHRGAAFTGSQGLIEELKRSVPIWKRPIYADAAPAW